MAKVNGHKRYIGRPAACCELPAKDGCLEIFRRCTGLCILCTTEKMRICTNAIRILKERRRNGEEKATGKQRPSQRQYKDIWAGRRPAGRFREKAVAGQNLLVTEGYA